MKIRTKEVYTEPLLVKHEPLRDITANSSKHYDTKVSLKDKAGFENHDYVYS